MTTIEFLTDLKKSGANVTVRDGKLRCEAPKGVLTDELKQRLANRKDEIIRLLQAETTASYREGPPYPDGLGRVKCFYCEHCEVTGYKATCRASKESRLGIALLITCPDFIMRTVH
jgi:hypothetical protein